MSQGSFENTPLGTGTEKYRKRTIPENENGAAFAHLFPGDILAFENPPTLWSGVLDHLETKGGGFLPPTPLRPGRLARPPPQHQLV